MIVCNKCNSPALPNKYNPIPNNMKYNVYCSCCGQLWNVSKPELEEVKDYYREFGS